MAAGRLFLVFITLFLVQELKAQTKVFGTVFDASTNEPLVGATIIFDDKGVVTNIDGQYAFELDFDQLLLKVLDSKKLEFSVSYVGYEKQIKQFELVESSLKIDVYLKTKQLNEVQVVADVAIDRKTPVAFSTIPVKKIEEELASQDIPMVLNSTPGVYATQQGGGDGDARITIRGFNQRNVAVMIDGVPVNDMENGWVYWSNWFGLDAVTSNIQVQRGLGASKIAIPSVGGTMNILTSGINNKRKAYFKQEYGSFGKLRSNFSYNSGKLKNDWAFTFSGSYKRGNGFVEETFSEGVFYYAKVQKTLGKHILSLTAMGAPQEHGQRSYKSDIATYSTEVAQQLGIADSNFGDITDKGIAYNKHWGNLNRWSLLNGDTINNFETLNTKKNYYHKPQFSLKDFWSVNDRLYISNIAYASIGNGGGTGVDGNTNAYDNFGQYNLQQAYDANSNNVNELFSDSEKESTTYLRSSINNHYWYGLLSTLNYQLKDWLTLSGGLDFRYYKGEHYREVYDLLGGDYIIDESNNNQNSLMKREGDIVGYHNDGLVKWSGLFSQLEYNYGNISAFINISGANSANKRIDYFKKKSLVLDDTTYYDALGTSVSTEIEFDENGNIIGATKNLVPDTLFHNGVAYTINSEEAQFSETDWKWIRGYTIKAGANQNIDDNNNVFFNIGYISKAPRFNNIYDYNNNLYRDIENEIVEAVELGYAYRSPRFSSNVNLYSTIWKNKPSNGGVSVVIDDVTYRANINGMDAHHKGVEIDAKMILDDKLSAEFLVSLGDWIWTSADTVRFYDDNNQPIIDDFGNEVKQSFDAAGVHVGDAAQTQYGFSLRYEVNDDFYLKLRGTYFSDYYSDFDPLSLSDENARRESWKIPEYTLFDFHAGYTYRFNKRTNLKLRLSVLNLWDEIYISDAQNNDPYNAEFSEFDAKSAGVFFGLGRRFNLSAAVTF